MKSLLTICCLIILCQVCDAQLPGRRYIWDLTDQGMEMSPRFLDWMEYKDGLRIIDSLSVKYRKGDAKSTLLWIFNGQINVCLFIVREPAGSYDFYRYNMKTGKELCITDFFERNILNGLVRDSLYFRNYFGFPLEPICLFTCVLYSSNYPKRPFMCTVLQDFRRSDRDFAKSVLYARDMY